MTFTEFKKSLIDADITLPKFSQLIKVSEKNLQSYKKKDEIPNAIAVAVTCFAKMNMMGIDYKSMIEELDLKQKKKKNSGFASDKSKKIKR